MCPLIGCMLLASAISERQDTAAFLRVFAQALRNSGAPEAVVTDGGGIFYSNRVLAIYEALHIRKEQIDPGQPWQNYVLPLPNIDEHQQQAVSSHVTSLSR